MNTQAPPQLMLQQPALSRHTQSRMAFTEQVPGMFEVWQQFPELQLSVEIPPQLAPHARSPPANFPSSIDWQVLPLKLLPSHASLASII